jgi:hypothetical protein
MYIVRDIFQLQFGHFRPAKALIDEALKAGFMPENKHRRILSDFTGDAYRLVLEHGFESLEEFEASFSSSMNIEEWQRWYEKFKPHVVSSSREIMKLLQ